MAEEIARLIAIFEGDVKPLEHAARRGAAAMDQTAAKSESATTKVSTSYKKMGAAGNAAASDLEKSTQKITTNHSKVGTSANVAASAVSSAAKAQSGAVVGLASKTAAASANIASAYQAQSGAAQQAAQRSVAAATQTINAHAKLESNLKQAQGFIKQGKDVESLGTRSAQTVRQLNQLAKQMEKSGAKEAAHDMRNLAKEIAGAAKESGGLMTRLKLGFAGGGLFGSSGGLLPGLANISMIIQGIPQIGQLAGAIIRPLTDAAEEGIRLNMILETSEIAFGQVAGSAEKAHQHVMNLQQFGARSPFRFEGLLKGAQLMNAFGFEIDEQIPKLTIWGNAIASAGELSEERVHRVITAFGQMRMSGKVNAQDMMQLTNANLPGWQLLARAIGKTVAETRKLSEAGKLNGKVAVEAITAMMAVDPRFKGMMERLEKTTQGRLSAAQDMFQIAQGVATKGLTENISKALGDVLTQKDLVGNVASTINSVIGPVSGLIETAMRTTLSGGITSGMSAGISLGKEQVKKVMLDFAADSILGPIKGVLGINSPSEVFKGYGYNSAEGYRDGLLLGLRSMTGEMMDGFDSMLDELEGHLQSRTKRFANVKERSKSNLDKLTQKEPDFLPKLIAMARARGMNPDHILNVMAVETAGSFNPFVRNPKSSASGMIQFMRDTAPTIGTTIEAIRKMNATQQLEYVFKYFDQYIRRFGPLDTQGKVYAAVGTGKVARDDEDVVMRRGQRGYAGNAPTWDRNMDGLVRQSEMAQAAISKLGAGIDFTVNGQPITSTNPLAVYMVKSDLTGGAAQIFRDQTQKAMSKNPQFSVDVSFDESSVQLADPVQRLMAKRAEELAQTANATMDASMLRLKPLIPMITEEQKDLNTQLGIANRTTEEWYKRMTTMGGAIQQLGSEMSKVSTLGDLLTAQFVSIPHLFGAAVGDAVGTADYTLRGFMESLRQNVISSSQQIAAEIVQNQITRSTGALLQKMVGKEVLDKTTGEPTGEITGGSKAFRSFLEFLGIRAGGLPPDKANTGATAATAATTTNTNATVANTAALQQLSNIMLTSPGMVGGGGGLFGFGLPKDLIGNLLGGLTTNLGGGSSYTPGGTGLTRSRRVTTDSGATGDAIARSTLSLTTSLNQQTRARNEKSDSMTSTLTTQMHAVGAEIIQGLTPARQGFFAGLFEAALSGAISGLGANITGGIGGSKGSGDNEKPTTPPVLRGPGTRPRTVGSRAGGGYFGPNEMFKFNERGPEPMMFTGSTSGYVVPFEKAFGGLKQETRSEKNINLTININDRRSRSSYSNPKSERELAEKAAAAISNALG